MQTTSPRPRRTRFLRQGASLAVLALGAAGCFGDSSTEPTPAADEPPALPAAERLTFNLGFFEDNPVTERSAKRNFFNAYVRAVTVGAITHLVLTPPITAFSLALNTVPSPQSDGSHIWVYTWVNGSEEAQIRLRGLPIEEGRVEWQLRVTNASSVPPIANALWFEGETWKDGAEGVWRFYDFEAGSTTAGARLDWGQDKNGEFLRFTDLAENVGDSLELRHEGVEARISYVDADQPDSEWFVRWNEANGTGSLKAPDYNSGLEACWDERQNDVVCGTPTL